MSFKEIERYIQEKEEIKSYPQVKAERDSLQQEKVKLEEKLAKAEFKIKELESLKLKFADRENITLEQAKEELLREMDAEVEERAKKKFFEYKSRFEKEKPSLVSKEILDQLKKIYGVQVGFALNKPRPEDTLGRVREAVEMYGKIEADSILKQKDKWPGWFKEYYQNEVGEGVKKGLSQEFERRVEEKAQQRAAKKLAQKIQEEWPNWYRQNIQPKLSNLEAQFKAGALDELRGPWDFTCNKCGRKVEDFYFNEYGLECLLKGEVEIECENPECTDPAGFLGLGRERHKIKYLTKDFFKAKIGFIKG